MGGEGCVGGLVICEKAGYICLSVYDSFAPPLTALPVPATLVAPSIEDVDAIFRGFADPTRIRILSLLAAGELCVCDIVEILDLPQPAVSRHLAYLRRTGLVAVRYEAKFAHYRLAAPTNAVHRNLVSCVRSCFLGIASLDEERAAAAARMAERARDGACSAPSSRSR